jgi:hypothetical protein
MRGIFCNDSAVIFFILCQCPSYAMRRKGYDKDASFVVNVDFPGNRGASDIFYSSSAITELAE